MKPHALRTEDSDLLLQLVCLRGGGPGRDLPAQYPAGIRIVRVMCSGMVHPKLVMDAFAMGADGVMVMG